MKPSGAGSVMADRARGEVAGDDAQTALHRRLEYFPTPPWAARAGGELIQRVDPGPWTCWEPACGAGHMAHGLGDYFECPVWKSDIHPQAEEVGHADFLATDTAMGFIADWIVTNPPFASAAQFVQLGLKRARRGVAILARATFFESAGRYPLFFPPGDAEPYVPLGVYAPFFERVPMTLGRWDPKASTATAYAWFVWPIAARRTGGCRVIPIPPGSRERLTRPDDARLFGPTPVAPLLEGR